MTTTDRVVTRDAVQQGNRRMWLGILAPDLLEALKAMQGAFGTLCERDLAAHITNRQIAHMIGAATQAKIVIERAEEPRP